MNWEKCETNKNQQGVGSKCNALQEKGSLSPIKLILLVSIVGVMVSALCGLFVWKLTETEVYHEFSKTGDLVRDFGIYGYYTEEHNTDVTVCIILIGILITLGIDVYIYMKNRYSIHLPSLSNEVSVK